MFQKFMVMAVVTFSLAAPSTSQAGMIYTFNQSNTSSIGPDGGNYGTVKLQDSSDGVGIAVGTVRFTFAISSARPGDLFQSLGINSDLSLSTLQGAFWSAPTGWTRDFNKNQDGFGNFNLVFAGGGGERVAPGVIEISGLSATDGKISHFQSLSNPFGVEGATYFAAHLIPANGFATGYIGSSRRGTSDGFGDQDHIATPAPAGLILAVLGIPAFSLLRRIGRKSRVAVAS